MAKGRSSNRKLWWQKESWSIREEERTIERAKVCMPRNSIIHTLLGEMEDGTATLQNSWQFFIKLNLQLPHDTAILLLGIYPREIRALDDTKTWVSC